MQDQFLAKMRQTQDPRRVGRDQEVHDRRHCISNLKLNNFQRILTSHEMCCLRFRRVKWARMMSNILRRMEHSKRQPSQEISWWQQSSHRSQREARIIWTKTIRQAQTIFKMFTFSASITNSNLLKSLKCPEAEGYYPLDIHNFRWARGKCGCALCTHGSGKDRLKFRIEQ